MALKRSHGDDDWELTPEEIREIQATVQGPPLPRSLDELMAAKDAEEFGDKLMALIRVRRPEPYQRMPPVSKLSVGVNAFRLETGAGGVQQFLLNSDPGLVEDCLGYLEAIGALRNRALLVQGLDLLPGKEVAAKLRARNRSMQRLERLGTADPFLELLRAHRRCRESLPRLLRKHVSGHESELARELFPKRSR